MAIQFLSGDYAGQYLAVTSGWVWDDGKDVDVQFMKAVSTNTTGDTFQTRCHLFSFEDADPNCCSEQGYPPFAGAYMLHSWVAETASQLFTYYLYSCSSTWGIQCPPSQNKLISNVTSMPLFYPTQYPSTPLVQDMGGGAFLLWAMADPYPVDDFTECSPLYAAENDYVYFTEFSTTASPVTLTIVDGFCFYRDGSQIDRNSLGAGEVALYEGENYTGLAVLLSASFPETTLLPLEQVGSVAFGLYTDTTIRFFSDPNYTNPVKTVGIDTPSIADLSGSDIGSIQVFDSRKVLISSKECPSCNLAGVDLSNLSLDGADLSNANLMNADLHVTSLKQGNLSGALLNGANLTNVNLSGASLLNASLNADSDMNLAAATLTGAYLQNVNCKGADLGGADFTNASFHTLALAYNPAGCGQDANNPPFTQNCASAEGANMDGARFNGAYLAGADFTGVTATAADFSGSVLTGAVFEGAHLDWDSATGASTNFTGAFVGGAKFTNATVQGGNFESAYVDFSTDPNEYDTYFTIPVAHTQFPGFDDSFGNTPCVQFSYSNATMVPDTQSGNTCPDGSPGPCDDTSWTSPVAPSDQSPWENSQGQTQPTWCSQVDLLW